jgi:hypothetical protein
MIKILLICYKLQAVAYYVASNVFKSAVGFFSFFSSTNVETKNVCPIAYNVWRLEQVLNVHTEKNVIGWQRM